MCGSLKYFQVLFDVCRKKLTQVSFDVFLVSCARTTYKNVASMLLLADHSSIVSLYDDCPGVSQFPENNGKIGKLLDLLNLVTPFGLTVFSVSNIVDS